MPEKRTGGMGVHVWKLSHEQQRMGHDVTVWCPINADETINGIQFKPWEYRVPRFQTELPYKLNAAAETILKMFRFGQSAPPDVIHCHEWDSGHVCSHIATYLDRPWVATLHISNILNGAYLTPEFTELCAYYFWWEQELLRRAPITIAISDHYRTWIERLNGGKPVRVIPNAVDVEDFGTETKEKVQGKITAFFHGRIVPQKGIGLIVEAAKQADDIHWVLAGPEPRRTDVRALEGKILDDLDALVAVGKITMLGMLSQAEIGAWLRGSDAAVYPHFAAPFDCAVLEALACGACVVTTGVEAISEYIEPDVDCAICQPTAESLLRAVRDSVLSPDRAMLLRSNAKRGAAHRTWRNVAEKTLAVYHEAISL